MGWGLAMTFKLHSGITTIFGCLCVAFFSIIAASAISAQSRSLESSETRTTVHYAAGIYRYIGNGQWSDIAKDKSYSHVLIETGTDENAIYLYDASRALTVQLNVRRFMIATGVNGAPLVDYVKISSTSGVPDQRRPSPPPQYNAPLPQMAFNGSNVTGVYYRTGGYRAVGQGKWHRYKADGSYDSELMETSREAMAIWLFDFRLNRRHKIDLARGAIGTSTNGSPVSYSYRIDRMESSNNDYGQAGRAAVQGRLPVPQQPAFSQGGGQAYGAAQPGNVQPAYPSRGAISALGNAGSQPPQYQTPQYQPPQYQPPQAAAPPQYQAPRTARPPAVVQPVSNDFVRFRSLVSRKCLEVDRGQTGNNVKIVQFQCDGSDEQALRLQSRGGNSFNIIAKHSGKCFDIPGGDPDDNVPIQHFDCDNSNEQLFAIRNLGGTTVNLLTSNGKCFDVPGGDTGDYVGINQFRCDGSIEQKFAMERTN